HGIKDIIFRRGKDGEGRIVVDLTDPGTGIDIQQRGKDLIVEFLKTDLPANLRRKLDVTDFGTPVVSVVTEESGRNVRMTITPKGKWEHNAYQADNQFVVEVRPIIEDPNKLVQGSKIGYQGPRISINYQNGDVRALLRLMAEELGLNVVISESVTGTTTLVLKDVPADQVIDIIFQQKGLDMRKKDNVMIIAPRDELAAREKLEFESRQQLEELEPLRTETFQLNYHDAEAFKKILTDKEQRILSKRGSAIIDPRSNILFIQDTPTRLEELRRVIATVDIPVRQVMIEARIVEANDQFARNLGARLGFFKRDGSRLWAGGENTNFNQFTGLVEGQATLPALNQVNFPAGTYKNVDPSQFSFLLFNSAGTRFLNLELSALEADLKGKIVSSPRVMTSDQVEAMIEQGVEIPYQNATSSGATSVEFKKATLSLRVKPHITPDGKISMRLAINKDSVGDVVPGGVSINTKKVETEVLVDNGGTIVIGGIYEMVNRHDENKVPFLGDVPLLGYAFKTTSRVNEKTELLVFITPRVVNNQLNLQ
ncbi:MAG: type IV pilus secretin PilQ, partial [Azovibrio sp.]